MSSVEALLHSDGDASLSEQSEDDDGGDHEDSDCARDSEDSGCDQDNCTTNDEESVLQQPIGGDVYPAVQDDNVLHKDPWQFNDVKEKNKSAVDDDGTNSNSVGDNLPVEDVLTQRDWRHKFVEQNPLYRRIKIRYCNVAFVKPRYKIPSTGQPVLYVCEGAENWNGQPNLLCAGQVLTIETSDWVILAVLWVGCITKKVGGRAQYSCAGKNMCALLFPLHTFDAADLLPNENELRLMSAFDILESEEIKMPRYMVVSRYKKAQRFFLALTLKYGGVSRFWNELSVMTTKKAEARRLQQKKRTATQRRRRRVSPSLTKKKIIRRSSADTRRSPAYTRSRPPAVHQHHETHTQPNFDSLTNYLKNQFDSLGNAIALALKVKPNPKPEPKPAVVPEQQSVTPNLSLRPSEGRRSRSHSRDRHSHRRRRSRSRDRRSRSHDRRRRSRSRGRSHSRGRDRRSRSRSRDRSHSRSRDRRSHSPDRRSRHRHSHGHSRNRHSRSHSPDRGRVCYVPCPYPCPFPFQQVPSSMYNVMNSGFDMGIPNAMGMKRLQNSVNNRYYDKL